MSKIRDILDKASVTYKNKDGKVVDGTFKGFFDDIFDRYCDHGTCTGKAEQTSCKCKRSCDCGCDDEFDKQSDNGQYFKRGSKCQHSKCGGAFEKEAEDAFEDYQAEHEDDESDELCDEESCCREDSCCESRGLDFTRASRKAFVREILCCMKSWLTAETDDRVAVTFEEMSWLRKGFGYKLRVEQNGDEQDVYDDYVKAVDFCRSMLFYVFNGRIDVGAYDDGKYATDFEVVSEI